MIRYLEPTAYVKNVFAIDYDYLRKNNIKLLCFDLDNTLDKPDQITYKKEPKINELITDLRKEFEILIVSNNTLKNRVDSFAKLYDLKYISAMKKPFLKNYKHDYITKYKKNEVIFIGDKIITDILGANRLGYKNILTDPLYPKHKTWYTKIMQVFEQIITIISSVKRGNYFNNFFQKETEIY